MDSLNDFVKNHLSRNRLRDSIATCGASNAYTANGNNGYLYLELTGSTGSLEEGGLQYNSDSSIQPYERVQGAGFRTSQLVNNGVHYQCGQPIGILHGILGSYVFIGIGQPAGSPSSYYLSPNVTWGNGAWQIYNSNPSDFFEPGNDPSGMYTPCTGCSVSKVTSIAQRGGDNLNDSEYFGINYLSTGTHAVVHWEQTQVGELTNPCYSSSTGAQYRRSEHHRGRSVQVVAVSLLRRIVRPMASSSQGAGETPAVRVSPSSRFWASKLGLRVLLALLLTMHPLTAAGTTSGPRTSQAAAERPAATLVVPAGSRPLTLDRATILVGDDELPRSRVAAFDRRTNKKLWLSEIEYDTRSVLQTDETFLLSGLDARGGFLDAIVKRSGARAWRKRGAVNSALAGYRVLASCTTCSRPNGTLVALDAISGRELWRSERAGYRLDSAIVNGPLLFAQFDNDGAALSTWLYVFRAVDGHFLWRMPVRSLPLWFSAGAVAVDVTGTHPTEFIDVTLVRTTDGSVLGTTQYRVGKFDPTDYRLVVLDSNLLVGTGSRTLAFKRWAAGGDVTLPTENAVLHVVGPLDGDTFLALANDIYVLERVVHSRFARQRSIGRPIEGNPVAMSAGSYALVADDRLVVVDSAGSPRSLAAISCAHESQPYLALKVAAAFCPDSRRLLSITW